MQSGQGNSPITCSMNNAMAMSTAQAKKTSRNRERLSRIENSSQGLVTQCLAPALAQANSRDRALPALSRKGAKGNPECGCAKSRLRERQRGQSPSKLAGSVIQENLPMPMHTLRQLFSTRALTLLVLLTLAGPANFAGAAAKQEDGTGPAYLDLGPAFTVNVGEAGNQLSYAKVELTLRIEGKPNLERADHHRPALRDILVTLLSNQPLEKVQDSDGREAVRLTALEQIQAFLEQEEGEQLVTDVLFTTFVVQR
ncbi:hypothetical protein soil367_16415 [Hydrocarboniclastica marina]|uniref:Flagellar protein FliL n=2 Tax=Hydrocarboniclastica marina TaxID=2259620 RepID=A0A4P7XMP6_9ALTE|nr:hypothetical protein soil367_16415 [Hydrocarboniclastica marina]